jgi:HEAT repeat protein
MKALGDLVTPELVRFLQRSTLPPQAARRAAATRIIAESGTMKSAAGLAGLLQHPEPEVRVIAAQGLARLAGGKDQGFNDAYWKGDKLEAGQKVWADWVQNNSK